MNAPVSVSQNDLQWQMQLMQRAESLASYGHWWVGLDDNSIFWSDQIYRIHGVTPETYTPELQSAIDFYHPDDQEKVRQYLQKAIETKSGFEFELRLIQPAGQQRFVYSQGVYEENPQRGRYLFGTFQDITEKQGLREAFMGLQLRTERELRYRAGLLKTFIKHTPAAVAMLDRQFRYLAYSDRWLQLFRLGARDLIGQSHTQVMPMIARHYPHWIKWYDASLVGETIERENESFVFADGTSIHTRIAIHPWRDESGAIGGILLFHEDMTEQLRLREEQDQLIDRLLKSNTDLERFAYVCSHDLQQPLRIIGNFAGLLEQDFAEFQEEPARQYLDFISENVTHARELVNSVMAYSRLDGEEDLKQDVDLADIVQQVIAHYQDPLRECGGGVRMEGRTPVLRGNRMMLFQLIQNLIGNAIKFRHKDEPPFIIIRFSHQEDQPVLEVLDNGIGIDPKHFEEIFRPFKRLHSKDDYRGSGMGLAICAKVAKAHGASIACHSRPEEGSCFTIRFPASCEIRPSNLASAFPPSQSIPPA